ncbi:Fpg/Nei family DNA glycosylase [Halalkalibacter nanhaiisediminis]|uniref:DNA-(apurinic or apyrimidinic site) lyase n=1 Tax=Halalkalibacter nanhaiisediminis TaxID=688079 RepID=A0A562QQF2_9BACI|nr:DNA-formamidopyrimidine glycosylase family protein [Halalkalibacter nanhaiisediminis]TWI58964.1 DNA-(apurinic or apyrimidinic site) lyase [Halalkalibacter nanhaiisediminis]
MAELPEMERYRTVLTPHLTAIEMTHIEVHREKSINIPVSKFISHLQGNHITTINRRAKHLIFDLHSGEHLLLHLMIGGWLFLGDFGIQPKSKAQIILSFGERKLYFVGLRLGYLHLLSTEELHTKLEKLGPEPLNDAFQFHDFYERIRNKRGTLKSILVDPTFIAGIGSCYSDEICFEARLKPTRKANELMNAEIETLFQAIKPVLIRAIEIGGYMDYPLYAGDEKTGQYNHHFLVYERENESCDRCGHRIEMLEVSSRKSFACSGCQV